MISYEYFDSGSVLIIKYKGVIDKATLINFIDFIYTKTNVDSLTTILSDYRDSDLIVDDDELKEVAETRLKYLKKLKSCVTIFLVAQPKETVLTTIISENYYKDLTRVQICSTLEYCIRKMAIDITVQELDNRIKNLKFNF